MSKKPEIISTTTVAESRLFRIEELDLTFSNGVKRKFERCRGALPGRGAVLVIPFLDERTVVLILEYAAGIDRYELTFPKGLIDAGETPFESVNRELKEEIGYGAKSIDFLKTVSISPNYMGGKMQLFVARDLYPEKLIGDEPEPLEVIFWPIDKLSELVMREDFSGSVNYAALFLAKQFLYHDDRIK